MKLYMFRTVRLSIIKSLFTVHSTMVHVIQVFRQLLYDIYHCWVYSESTPGDGQTNCPKHVEFHAKINWI